MKTLTVGSYDVECPFCTALMLTMRAGAMDKKTKMARVIARCERCNETQRVNVKLDLTANEKLAKREKAALLSRKPAKQAKKAPKTAKKRVKRPATRTIAGLRGRCEGKGARKEWHFTYRTKYAPLLLRMHKRLGYWSVYFGELRMGSGKTMIEALEQAKRRMSNCGYELA